ncbi:hypothetical protein [Promicromonospora sp. NPDC050880]|uniref:hypothetical protein n=1 Tax=Promicromonospora sp. NPDC050880 TaxID=3364406 RepID=UPI00378D4452
MSRRRERIPDHQQDSETAAYWRAQNQLVEIADAWVELDELLAAGSTPGSGASKPASRAPIDAHVADVRAEISGWVQFLARALMEEVTVERWPGVPWAAGHRVAELWAPPTIDTGELVRHIAHERIGHFVMHPDQQMRADFLAAAEEWAGLARRTAWPSGARWLRTGVECTEHDTSDLGQRVPCEGEYRVFMHPDQEQIPDMVCDVDPGHRITPLEWQRAQRRKPMNPQAAARLARTLRLTGRIGA